MKVIDAESSIVIFSGTRYGRIQISDSAEYCEFFHYPFFFKSVAFVFFRSLSPSPSLPLPHHELEKGGGGRLKLCQKMAFSKFPYRGAYFTHAYPGTHANLNVNVY